MSPEKLPEKYREKVLEGGIEPPRVAPQDP